MHNKLAGKVVLIVGVSNLLMREIIRFCLQQGARVVAPCKSLGAINAIKQYVAALPEKNLQLLVTFLTDVPDFDKAVETAETTLQEFGKIDIAITYFSSSSSCKKFEAVNVSDWQSMMDGNVSASFVCARVVLNSMKENKTGMYINISDEAVGEGDATPPISKIASFAKLEMSRIFVDELKESKIKYYHLALSSSLVNADGIAEHTEPQPLEQIGHKILALYQNTSHTCGDVLQRFHVAAALN